MKFDWWLLGQDMDAYAKKRGFSKRGLGRELDLAPHTLERIRDGNGVSVETLVVILRALRKKFERYTVSR